MILKSWGVRLAIACSVLVAAQVAAFKRECGGKTGKIIPPVSKKSDNVFGRVPREVTTSQRLDFMVQIKDNSGVAHVCNGVLLTPEIVASSASCIHEELNVRPFNLSIGDLEEGEDLESTFGLPEGGIPLGNEMEQMQNNAAKEAFCRD
ncbi:hypothetical protein BSKO_11759 [Bryopsis sp. KO-2023]|nr:hypothetical protein BSKO_11759 [Bryopsis sp. KO-2023]